MMASRRDVDASMTVRALMRHPTGYLPVAMSLGALAMIVWFVAVYGVIHQPDEGAQAHLWQLLVVGQVPAIAYFALRGRSPVGARRPVATTAHESGTRVAQGQEEHFVNVSRSAIR
jgi:hypothetical protein